MRNSSSSSRSTSAVDTRTASDATLSKRDKAPATRRARPKESTAVKYYSDGKRPATKQTCRESTPSSPPVKVGRKAVAKGPKLTDTSNRLHPLLRDLYQPLEKLGISWSIPTANLRLTADATTRSAQPTVAANVTGTKAKSGEHGHGRAADIATQSAATPDSSPSRNRNRTAKEIDVNLSGPGFLRLSDVLALLRVSKSSFYQGVKDGLYPRQLKLSIGPKTRSVGWSAVSIATLLTQLENRQSAPSASIVKEGIAGCDVITLTALEKRVLDGFVTIAIAGELAIRLDVLELKRGVPKDAIRHVYQQWLECWRGSSNEALDAPITTLRGELRDSKHDFVPLHKWDHKDAKRIPGYIKTTAKGVVLFLIYPHTFTRMCRAHSEDATIRALRHEGLLVTDQDARTKLTRMPGRGREEKGRRMAFYAVRQSILFDDA